MPAVSQASRSTAKTLDTCSIAYTIFSNSLVAFRLSNILPRTSRVSILASAASRIAVAVTQYAWCKYWPDSYFQNRPLIRLFHRLWWLLLMVVYALNIRSWLYDPDVRHYVAALAAPRASLYAAFSLTMLLSGTIHVVSTSASAPLPFKPQLLFHSIYLLVLTVMLAQPAAALIRMSPYGVEVHIICSGLSTAMMLLVDALTGVHLSAGALDKMCIEHGSLLFVLFVNAYFGFVLPVYMAYRLAQQPAGCLPRHEQQDGRQQQQQEQQEQDGILDDASSDGSLQCSEHVAAEAGPTPYAVVCALLLDMGTLLLLAVLCWYELVTTRQLLTGIMWHLDPARVVVSL